GPGERHRARDPNELPFHVHDLSLSRDARTIGPRHATMDTCRKTWERSVFSAHHPFCAARLAATRTRGTDIFPGPGPPQNWMTGALRSAGCRRDSGRVVTARGGRRYWYRYRQGDRAADWEIASRLGVDRDGPAVLG